MPIFAARVPRLAVLVVLVTAFAVVTPETLARGPGLCLWRRLFHIAACPACGTLHALSAAYHGRLAEALRFNHNVLITAPGTLALLLLDLIQLVRRVAHL